MGLPGNFARRGPSRSRVYKKVNNTSQGLIGATGEGTGKKTKWCAGGARTGAAVLLRIMAKMQLSFPGDTGGSALIADEAPRSRGGGGDAGCFASVKSARLA